MLTTIVTSFWMCLPIAPLNPIEQDTLPAMALQVSAGVTSPNHIVSTGPELSLKYELLATHPLVLRTSLDYQFGSTRTTLWPGGTLHQASIELTAFYYRGTDKLTGYIGAGPVFRFGYYNLSSTAKDSLWAEDQIDEVSLKQALGYRIFLGMRFSKVYVLEVGVSEVESDIVYHRRPASNVEATYGESTKLSAFRITFGYLWTLKEFW